jgi:hypothetical protein
MRKSGKQMMTSSEGMTAAKARPAFGQPVYAFQAGNHHLTLARRVLQIFR